MTRDELRQRAQEKPDITERIQRTGKKDTYVVVEVFKDSAFDSNTTMKCDKDRKK